MQRCWHPIQVPSPNFLWLRRQVSEMNEVLHKCSQYLLQQHERCEKNTNSTESLRSPVNDFLLERNCEYTSTMPNGVRECFWWTVFDKFLDTNSIIRTWGPIWTSPLVGKFQSTMLCELVPILSRQFTWKFELCMENPCRIRRKVRYRPFRHFSSKVMCQRMWDSFFDGKGSVTLKNKITQPSTPMHHSTEAITIFHKTCCEDSINLNKPILIHYTDGGPDHSSTYGSVEVAGIAALIALDADIFDTGRTHPGGST